MHGKSCSYYSHGYCLIGCRSHDIKPGQACSYNPNCACHSKGLTHVLAKMVSRIINKKKGSVKMKMPYGKYKGKDIDQLPSGYLRWVAENWKEDIPQNRAICEAADKEYQYRERQGLHFSNMKNNDGLLCPHCGKLISDVA